MLRIKRRSRSVVMTSIGLFVLVVLGFYTLAVGRVVLNGSDSLPDTAYFMVTWPKVIWRGSYVAVPAPSILKTDGADVVLVKRVAGIAGDKVEIKQNEANRDVICINTTCVEPYYQNGKAWSNFWKEKEIKFGWLGLLGTSPDSLDSRYDVIGGFDLSSVKAVGIPIPWFPTMERLREWLG